MLILQMQAAAKVLGQGIDGLAQNCLHHTILDRLHCTCAQTPHRGANSLIQCMGPGITKGLTAVLLPLAGGCMGRACGDWGAGLAAVSAPEPLRVCHRVPASGVGPSVADAGARLQAGAQHLSFCNRVTDGQV